MECTFFHIRQRVLVTLLAGATGAVMFLYYSLYDQHYTVNDESYKYSRLETQDYVNVFASVRKDGGDYLPEATNDQQTLECSEALYGGNVHAGLNDVIPLRFTLKGQFVKTTEQRSCGENILPADLELDIYELRFGQKCLKYYEKEHTNAQNAFWAGNTHLIRQRHHTYLTPNSIVIEIGGNVGEDASAIMDIYHPNAYILLEPIKPLYDRLKARFNNTKNVYVYNFGAGKNLSFAHVKVGGQFGDATSVFAEAESGECLIKIVNTTEFMLLLGVGCFEVDLLTMNCEGCEFDVLESLISTNLIEQFRNIQFATHPSLKHLQDPVSRYCEIIQVLSRTHRPSYRYGFTWESWTRKNL